MTGKCQSRLRSRHGGQNYRRSARRSRTDLEKLSGQLVGSYRRDTINYSDGLYTNNTNFASITPALTPALTSSDIVQLYASKHDPFVYFSSIQEGVQPGSGLTNIVGFEGPGGLYGDLQSGNAPELLVYRAQSVQRSTWARQCRAILRFP